MHIRWLNTISQSNICAYSDGSSEGHGRSSLGFVLQRNSITFHQGSGHLLGSKVVDAEIIGALCFVRDDGHIYVLLDNQAAVSALLTGTATSCLRSIKRFRELANRSQATVKWIPGHSAIKGNEEADAAAPTSVNE